jgi:hypothetical protein
MKVTDEMLKPFKGITDRENKSAIIDAIQDMLKGMVSKKSLKVVIDAMPKQEPVCYVDQPNERLVNWNIELFHFSFELPEEGTPLYTHPQPQPPHEPMSVTRHEVETAMMLCEINFCENPSEYVYWILDNLGIGVEK